MALEIRRGRAELTSEQSDVVEALKSPAIPPPPRPSRSTISVVVRGGEKPITYTHYYDHLGDRETEWFTTNDLLLSSEPPVFIGIGGRIYNVRDIICLGKSANPV